MNAPVKFDDPTKLDWWSAALKGERRPITEDPMTGYYRARRKNKQNGEEKLYAVAYWWHNGRPFCKVDAGPTLQGEQHDRMMAAWPYVSKEPIKYDVYQAALAGKPWPDQHVAEKAAPAETSNQPLDAEGQVTTTAPAAGAAEPVDNSPQGVLKREIKAAKAGLAQYGKRDEKGNSVSLIDSDEKAGAGQSLRDTLNKLATKAKKAREDANRPHREKIEANGKIWSPLEDEAKTAADALRDGPLTDWERHKRTQAAAAAKAAEASSAASGTTVQPVSNAPAPSAKIKGATGKAASVQEVKVAIITDFDAVYTHFKTNDQVKAILQGLANAAVRAGIPVPGTKTDTDVKIT